MLTQERLKELLDYDPETGVFTWKVVTSNRIKIGDQAGARSRGYVVIKIDGAQYRAHRLAWLYVHGCWPKVTIDHINRIKNDNRIENLREATSQEQSFNVGAKGCCWHKVRRKWYARIKVNNKRLYLGQYATEEEARAAYLAAKEELHIIGEQQ